MSNTESPGQPGADPSSTPSVDTATVNTRPELPPVEKELVIAGAHSSEALRVGDVRPKRRSGGLLDAFKPNRAVSGNTMRLLIIVEAVIALAIWAFSPFEVLPNPAEVWTALQDLWMTRGLGQELPVS